MPTIIATPATNAPHGRGECVMSYEKAAEELARHYGTFNLRHHWERLARGEPQSTSRCAYFPASTCGYCGGKGRQEQNGRARRCRMCGGLGELPEVTCTAEEIVELIRLPEEEAREASE